MAISPQRLTIYLYSAHRAVIFAIAQLSCFSIWYWRQAATIPVSIVKNQDMLEQTWLLSSDHCNVASHKETTVDEGIIQYFWDIGHPIVVISCYNPPRSLKFFGDRLQTLQYSCTVNIRLNQHVKTANQVLHKIKN